MEAAGNKAIDYEGKRTARKRALAAMLWEGASTGKATMPDGGVLELGPTDWFALVKFIYGHIDGPPSQRFEHTGDEGGPIKLLVEYVNNRKDHTADTA